MNIWSRLRILELKVKNLERETGVEPRREGEEWILSLAGGRSINLNEKIQAILDHQRLRITRVPEAVKAVPIVVEAQWDK